MSEEKIISKAESNNIGDVQVQKFMNPVVVTLLPTYTVKTTIETFKNYNISSAPVVDEKGHLLGIVSEFDLLIQASTNELEELISYTTNVIAINPEQTLKDVLKILFKHKLKNIPVINSQNYVVGNLTRIGILLFISEHD